MSMSSPGPRLIVGHVSEKSARVWGRGDAENPVMFLTSSAPDGQEQERILELSPQDGYTGVVDLEGLKPETDYELDVSYGPRPETPEEERVGRQEGDFETFPEPGQSKPFTLMLNSCNFHGWGPLRNNNKANKRRAEIVGEADLVIHAGDQVYADKAPLSYTLADFRNAYERAWGDEGVDEVLAGRANYMIPSDHEVVNGFARDGELTRFQRFLLWARGHGGAEREQYEEMTENALQAFQEFQRSHGPESHGKEANYYSFSHGEHQFFAMDTRLNRNNGEGRMFGPEQRDALFSWLTAHREQPKFIVTSSPFVMESKNPEEKWNSPEFEHHRHELIDFLAREKIDNLVFLSGDVHASGHAQMTIEAPDGEELVIHELVSSPINGSLLRPAKKFDMESQGSTASGTDYAVEVEQSSLLTQGRLPTIANSNVLMVDIDGEEITYQYHRTRRKDSGPARAGSFTMGT